MYTVYMSSQSIARIKAWPTMNDLPHDLPTIPIGRSLSAVESISASEATTSTSNHARPFDNVKHV